MVNDWTYFSGVWLYYVAVLEMSVRGKIKTRMAFLSTKGKKAAKEGDQQTALDCYIRQEELRLLLKEMKK